MSKKTLLFVVIILVLVILSVVVFLVEIPTCLSEFQEGHQTINNPNRGFYIQVDSGDNKKISKVAEDARLILLAYDIKEFHDCDISDDKLKELKLALETAKAEHLSVIFRAAYSFDENVVEPDQITQIGRHIAQIAEILNEYSSQISVVQAGLLGEYGEWHGGIYFKGNEEEQRASRAYILKQWEKRLDPSIKVAVRRPRFIREAEIQGILVNRLGLHNDALVSTDSDMGTYDDQTMSFSEELNWMEDKLVIQYNGGEMPMIGERSKPQNVNSEFKKLHLSYLNLKYNEEVLTLWKNTSMHGMEFNGSAFDFIEHHLGYRLFVSKVVRKETLFSRFFGDSVHLEISIKNSGYACLPEQYNMYLLIEDGSGTLLRSYELKIPEMHRITNGETSSFGIDIPIDWNSEGTRNEVLVKLKIGPEVKNLVNADCVELANEVYFPYNNGNNYLIHMEQTDSLLKGRTAIDFIKKQ